MEKLLQNICQALVDKKAHNIIVLDVKTISSMTDFFIIAEGTVPRHVVALAKQVDETLSESKLSPSHIEGEREGDWVVLDYMDIVVHLFTSDLRKYYSLEEIWHEGKVVDIPVNYGR